MIFIVPSLLIWLVAWTCLWYQIGLVSNWTCRRKDKGNQPMTKKLTPAKVCRNIVEWDSALSSPQLNEYAFALSIMRESDLRIGREEKFWLVWHTDGLMIDSVMCHSRETALNLGNVVFSDYITRIKARGTEIELKEFDQ
jgi:hypothetical protein